MKNKLTPTEDQHHTPKNIMSYRSKLCIYNLENGKLRSVRIYVDT